MPAEWARHEATWLTYPKNPDSWPGKIETIYPSYHLFAKTLAEHNRNAQAFQAELNRRGRK